MIPNPPEIRLSAESLLALANYFLTLSEHYQAEASRQAERERSHHPKPPPTPDRRFLDAGQLVEAYRAQGLPYKTAIDAARAASGLSADQVQFAWSYRKREITQSRNQAAAWLKGKGWSNAQIAEATGLHPAGISRALEAGRRKNRAPGS